MNKHLLLILLFLGSLTLHAQFSGNALDFDGSDDAVTITGVPSILATPGNYDISIEAWVNPRSIGFQRIFFAQASNTNYITLATGTVNTIYFYVIVNATTYSASTTAALAQNTWTHVAATWNSGSNTPLIYFNGVLQTTGSGGTSSSGTSGLVTIGTRPGGGTQYFNGALDELRVWNKTLSACEINDNMNRSIIGAQTSLIMNYNFNSGVASGNNISLTSLNDISGEANNGVLTGFALNGATSNWVASAAALTSTGNIYSSLDVTVTTSGNTITASQAGATYIWQDCDNFSTIANETGQSYTATTSGNYAVIIDYNSCVGLSECTPITVLSTKVPLLTTPVSVYPNPVRDILTIEIEDNTTGTIELTNLSGRVIRSQIIEGKNSSIDLNGVEVGTYLINIITPEGRLVKKVVKNN